MPCVAHPAQSQFSPHVHAPMTTSSFVGNDMGASISTSMGSILTPPLSAIRSNVLIPGRPSAERGISSATVPSSRNMAPKNLFMSARGRNLGGGGRTGELELAQPLCRLGAGPTGLSLRFPCRGVLLPDVEYGEYSLVLCTWREVWAGWCMLSGER